MSGGAPKEALAVLIPIFEKLTGHRVKMSYAVISAIQQKLAAGAIPDMVFLPMPAIAEHAKAGKLKIKGSAPFGTVKIVAIVKAGAPRPDISTPDAVRDTLLKARSVVYSTPTATPSGAHMARMVAELQIADAVEKKVAHRPALDGGVEMVAAGDAEIGFYPSSEVAHVEGVAQVGPLPDALQLLLNYGGAVSTANPMPGPALAFIEFLAAKENKAVWKQTGFEPS
ncbi:MAG: substrate-binding domain-containing protein [Pseudolabrys sp.]|nr:substrate-binding domain-containing protein [Pseudolabrys sp.]